MRRGSRDLNGEDVRDVALRNDCNAPFKMRLPVKRQMAATRALRLTSVSLHRKNRWSCKTPHPRGGRARTR